METFRSRPSGGTAAVLNVALLAVAGALIWRAKRTGGFKTLAMMRSRDLGYFDDET